MQGAARRNWRRRDDGQFAFFVDKNRQRFRLNSAFHLLNGPQFAVVQPDILARVTRIDDNISRTIVRMNFHLLVAVRATYLSLVFFRVQQFSGLRFAPFSTSSAFANDGTKVFISDQYAVASAAVQNRAIFQAARLQALLANRAVSIRFASGSDNAIDRQRVIRRKHQRLAIITLHVFSAGHDGRGTSTLLTPNRSVGLNLVVHSQKKQALQASLAASKS